MDVYECSTCLTQYLSRTAALFCCDNDRDTEDR